MTSTENKVQMHQFLAVLESGDAISNHALAIRDFLKGKGHQSEIFVWRAGRGMRKYCRDYLEYHAISSPENVMIYHFGVASPITRFFLKAPDRKVVIYHNVTPQDFYRGVNDYIYYILKKGRLELEAISEKVELAIADSEFNREELVQLGFKNTVTVPLLIDFSRYEIPAAASIINKYNDGKVNVIFVGRISPNKKQEDVIRAFSVYRKYINNNSRLFIIGHNRQVSEYNVLLKKLVEKLGVEDVHLTGGVSQSELNAYYTIADIFLCMSEHEGFCIPLIECMHFGVSVLAYESSAVTGTLDGSGVLFTAKDFSRIAEMMDIIVNDENMKERIIRGQKERLRRFQRDEVEKQLLKSLTEFMN